MRNAFCKHAILLALGTAALVGSAAAQTQIMYTTSEIGFNRPGSDIRGETLIIGSPWQLCASRCRAERRCRSWTWVRDGVMAPSPMCWLKSGLPSPVPDPVAISGVITEPR
jgi:hypothetical protein